MPTHRYNRNSFGAMAGQPGLASLYCALVRLEIALKERNGWTGNHDVPAMVSGAGEASLAQQLGGLLGRFSCTDAGGDRTMVRRNMYPDLRYVRHVSDFPADQAAAQDTDLVEGVAILSAIESRLTARGVAL
jgi:hypothetical protein